MDESARSGIATGGDKVVRTVTARDDLSRKTGYYGASFKLSQEDFMAQNIERELQEQISSLPNEQQCRGAGFRAISSILIETE